MENLQDTYDIYEVIGEGGGGRVYRAFHRRLQKMVILKQINNAGSFMTKRAEVDILKNLRHSYLPQVIDFLETYQGVFTVMDYIPGKTLGQMVSEGVRFTEQQVLKYATEVCEALAYLHAQPRPIVHSDIKPDNIMITPDGHVCLIDFNVSGVLEGDHALVTGCTPSFASPEQMNILNDARMGVVSRLKIDQRTDIYSLAATIYSVMTGAYWKYDLNDLKEFPASDGLTAILYKALSVQPEDRYQDAVKLLVALRNVYKKDKRYKNLIARQNVIYILLSMLLAGSIFCTVTGIRVREKEKRARYETLVNKLDTNLSEKEFDKIFDDAVELYPDEIAAYYQKAFYIHENVGYDETIEYLDKLLEEDYDGTNQQYGNVYYLYGESYFQKEEYSQAEIYFKTALKYDDQNVEVYRDYAITLVYLGKVEEAKKTLDKAITVGITEADIYMVQGEIAKMEGDYQLAVEDMQKVLSLTKDEYMKLRAYVVGSKAYQEMGTVEGLNNDITWLHQGITELSAGSTILLYERLAQDYIDLGDMTGDNSGYLNAIKTFEDILYKNWGTYLTYSNIVVLYQRLGQTANAVLWADKMITAYPEMYQSYMRRAFVEIDVQNEKANQNRDYSEFDEFYSRAEELYDKQKSGNETDSEMLLLENTHDQVVAGGWLTD